MGAGFCTGRGTRQNIIDMKRSKAKVDEGQCTGCGLCLDACKQNAITIGNIARIDLEKCTGCGKCVNECPNQAISLE